MKIPASVQIGGHRFAIIEDYVFRERSTTAGQIDHNTCEIRLSSIDGGGQARHRSVVEETFLHEIVHAVDGIYCGGDKMDDNLTEQLAQGLYQVLQQIIEAQQ